MIVLFKKPYDKSHTDGVKGAELRIGWASWDNGDLKNRSIKYAYQDVSGKISRGSPEIPFSILVDMTILAIEKNELSETEKKLLKKALDSSAQASR